MMKEWFSSVAMVSMEMLGLVIFAAVFAAIVLWTFRSSGKSRYQSISQLPLDSQKETSHV